MSKHTQGPWRVNTFQSDVSEGRLSIEAKNEYFIAQVDPSIEQEANANLIAAAPELLQCLKDHLRSFESIHALLLEIGNPDFIKLRDDARAAIAKSEGKQS